MSVIVSDIGFAAEDWEAGFVPLAEVGRIGVGTGPGNFTGLRIAVSAARGLALARGIPAIGVSTFEVIHHGAPGALAGVPAPRGQLYVMAPGTEPRQVAQEAALDAVLPPAPAALAATGRCLTPAGPMTRQPQAHRRVRSCAVRYRSNTSGVGGPS